MGISTDGILVYGIAYEDEGELPEFLVDWAEENDTDPGDFDDYLDSISGLPNYGEPGHDFSAQRAWRETCPVDLVRHCSYECPMYILAVRGTEITARRGYPQVINTLDVSGYKIDAFNAWCKERGIVGEPKWYLCSMWG